MTALPEEQIENYSFTENLHERNTVVISLICEWDLFSEVIDLVHKPV